MQPRSPYFVKLVHLCLCMCGVYFSTFDFLVIPLHPDHLHPPPSIILHLCRTIRPKARSIFATNHHYHPHRCEMQKLQEANILPVHPTAYSAQTSTNITQATCTVDDVSWKNNAATRRVGSAPAAGTKHERQAQTFACRRAFFLSDLYRRRYERCCLGIP